MLFIIRIKQICWELTDRSEVVRLEHISQEIVSSGIINFDNDDTAHQCGLFETEARSFNV